MIRHLSLLVGIILIGSHYLKAEQVYLLFDKSCMHRYEYRYINQPQGASSITYHVLLNTKEKVVLEVGVENTTTQAWKPTGLKTCKEVALNERMVRQINDGLVEFFLVRQLPEGYQVSPVGVASYTQVSQQAVGMSTLDGPFQYKFADKDTRSDLSTNKGKSSVFLKGMASIANECPSVLVFERTKNGGGRSYEEMLLIPDLGVIQEKSGFTKEDAQQNTLRLFAIDGLPVQEYLSRHYCPANRFGQQFAGVFFDLQLPGTKEMPVATSSPSPSSDKFWVMEGGQPLPSKVGSPISTEEVKAQETVKPEPPTFTCDIYKDPSKGIYLDRATSKPANITCQGKTYRNGYLLVNGEPVEEKPDLNPSSAPTTVVSPISVLADGSCSETSSPGIHIVQKGETLFGIAKLYNTKPDQIRLWNQLSEQDVIKPCMRLYTNAEAKPKAVETDLAAKGSTQELPVLSPEEAARWHVVISGESLYSLASKYGYTVERFRKMNQLGPNDTVKPGMKLLTNDCVCPPATKAPATSDANHVPSQTNTETPASKSDALPSEFTTKGSLPTTEVKEAPSTVEVEQPVTIKAEPQHKHRTVHIVKDNDTLSSIARLYNTSVQKLRTLNNLDEQEVIIPAQKLYID